ncbi:unnamed protein product, partial [Ectocarpus sp. 4 AP-2014]
MGENSTVPQAEPIMFQWVDVMGVGQRGVFYFLWLKGILQAVVGTCFSPSALLGRAS